MKILNSFKTNPLEHLIKILFLLTALSLPFSIKVNNVFIVALIFLICIYVIRRRHILSFDNEIKKKVLIFISLFLIQIFGLLYTEQFNEAKHHLEVKLTILLLPITFAVFSIDSKLRKEILVTFLISCSLACLVSIFFHFSFYTNNSFYYALSNISYLVHTALPKLGIHPVYFSAYLLFSIVIAFHLFYSVKNKGIKLLIISDVIVLSIFIILLASRIAIFIYSTLLFALLWNALQNKTFFYKATVNVLVVGIIILTVYNLPVTKVKVHHLLSQFVSRNYNTETNYVDGVSNRIQKWRASALVIKENFLLGVGTGDASQALLDTYESIGFTEGLEENYNAHNEYLQEFIRHGIIGFTILILCYLYSFLISIQKKDWIYLLFIIIISSISLTESILSVQKGVVFYAFFNSLLAFKKEESTTRAFRGEKNKEFPQDNKIKVLLLSND